MLPFGLPRFSLRCVVGFPSSHRTSSARTAANSAPVLLAGSYKALRARNVTNEEELREVGEEGSFSILARAREAQRSEHAPRRAERSEVVTLLDVGRRAPRPGAPPACSALSRLPARRRPGRAMPWASRARESDRD